MEETRSKRTVYCRAIDPESKFTGASNKYDLLFTRGHYFQVFNLWLTLHKLQQSTFKRSCCCNKLSVPDIIETKAKLLLPFNSKLHKEYADMI